MEALIDQLNKDRPQTTKGLETYLENWNKDEFYNTLTQKDIDGIVKKLDDLNASSIIFICKILGIKNCRALKTSTQDRKNLIKENLEHYLQNQVLKPKNKFVPCVFLFLFFCVFLFLHHMKRHRDREREGCEDFIC